MGPQNPEAGYSDSASIEGAKRVKTMACLSGVSLERGVPTEEVHDYIRDLENLVWMDVQDPGPEELSMLMEEFGFHPLALEDVANGQQRPKVDEYKGHLFVVTYCLVSANTKDLQTAEIDLFIARNYLVSIHRGRVPALEEAAARWTRGGEMLREGVGFLVYTVMDAIIDSFFPIIDEIEEEVNRTEMEMFTHFNQSGIENLLKLKRALVALRRVLYPLREIFHVFLRREQSYFSGSTLIYFQDVYDHVLRILDVLDTEREMVNGAMEAHLTVISNRLNQTMKTLTVITICVAIVGSVFGAWGMNVEIPFAQTPGGFWIVLGGTLAIVGLALMLAWKREWL